MSSYLLLLRFYRKAKKVAFSGLFSLLVIELFAQTPPRAKVFEDIQQRIDSMKQAMLDLGASNLPEAPVISPKMQSYNSQPSAPPASSKDNFKAKTSTKSLTSKNENGIYFIPFLGISVNSDFNGALPLVSGSVNHKFEPDNGSSVGLRLGYAWKYFFLEERLSYLASDIKKSSPPDFSFLINRDLSGKINSLSFQQSLGFRIPITKNISVSLGGGVGLSKQEITINISPALPIPLPENKFDEWLLTYDAILGLEYQPFDHLLTGINYRWMRVEEMDHFEARDLHLLELSLGVLF